jgi:hypothetical protein
MQNARYLEGVPKGEKSDVVNRALAYYRAGGRSKEEQIRVLSEKLHESYQIIDKMGLQGGGGDTNSTVNRSQRQRISIYYVLTYPFQLLKNRLRRR